MSITIFPHKLNFDFMGKRWLGFAFSIILSIASVGLLATQGLNLGIDFTGGVLMEIRTQETTDIAKLREVLGHQGFGEISLQNIGDIASGKDVMIRIQVSEKDDQSIIIKTVKTLLETNINGKIEYQKIDFVGPTVGQELIESGIYAVLSAFACIMIYVWFRFEWQYGVGAILALVHDSILIIGFFALTRLEFGLTAVAAILTIIGYSINDSVVIYDRIRENMRKFKKMSISDLLNISINETLSRTVLTASTTLLASISLLVFGGEVIHSFSAAMVFGVIIGTYSSIFISAPALIYLNLREKTENDANIKETK